MSLSKPHVAWRALLLSSAVCLVAGIAGAQAQDATQPGSSDTQAQTIVVTGSRIVRRDYQSNSPIVTVGKNLLQNSSTGAIETNLNKLPAFTPVQTPNLGGDIQATATDTPGAATISLRSLGTNRNLVLIDGRRAVPANALGVVDINTIPAVAIDRVEVITGGASAVYGADAVAGVANFIMKKDFQGLQIDAQTAISQRGDGFEYKVSGIMGSNFADDRGNITIALSTNDRDAAYRRDRAWQVSAWKDPRFVGTEFFPDFSAYQPIAEGGVLPTQASMDALFGAGAVPTGSRIYFNADGTAFTGFFQSPPGGAFRFNGDLTTGKWAQTADGALKQNFQDALLTVPLRRYNIYSNGHYQINDWLTAFAQANFSRVTTTTAQQPSPSVNGWSAFVPASEPVPAELRTILDSRVIPTGTSAQTMADLNCDPGAVPGAAGSGATCDWQLTYYLNYANRVARTDVTTYNITTGLDGKFPFKDWTWELFASQGESQTDSLITGNASLERFRTVIASPNWGAGFSQQGNPAFGGFGASSATCTSGLDPFNKSKPISQDCIDAIKGDLQNRAVMTQTVWEFDAQGGLFDLPAGEVRGSLGATHRQNKYTYQNDTLTSQGVSFQDQAIGIYPSGSSRGTIEVNEGYGELLVPVLADLPFVKKLEFDLGARDSEYNTTGGSFTWKVTADWQVLDWLRIRGGYNKAVRAPNVAELYLSPQQTFTAAGSGDVCRLNNTLPYSANPATNANAANVLAVCKILMDSSGIAGTSTVFYSDPQFYNAAGPAFAFPTLVGNPNVKPEKAKTWTLGAVISSPSQNPLLSRLSASVDFYDILVDDAIGPQTLDTAQLQCFDPYYNPAISTNPAAAAASPFCQAIGRVAGDGALGNVQVTYLNSGRFRSNGIDTQIDWSYDIGPGTFNFHSVFNYLISLKSAGLPTVPETEYAGTLGPAANASDIAENGLNAGSFRWKMLNTFNYAWGAATISLQWQHLPSAESISYPSNNSTPFVGAPAYDLFNLSGTYALTKDMTLRVGVDNLFDTDPPLTEYNASATGLANSIGGNPINSYFYDLVGRRFYVGVNANF